MANGNGKAPIPFLPAQQAATPIVGQPFTITTLWIPVNMTLTCNCGGADTGLQIVGSVSATCPGCQKTYNAAFNPQTNKIEMRVAIPEKAES